MKWGICYKEKAYIQMYGKKKAYTLLYQLNMCLLGLSVSAMEPNQKLKSKKKGLSLK